MAHKTFRSLALVWIASGSLLGSGCGDDSSPPAADSTGGDGSSGTTAGGTLGATGQNATEGLDTTAGSSGMADGSFLDPTMASDGANPLPNGGQCAGNDDCESGYCFQIPMLGGLCSECLMDTDCGMGTCSLDPTVLYAVCTDGSIGVMCDSDEGCMDGLVCAQLIDTGGLFPLDFCSECDTDAPCEGEQLCSPVYNLETFQGYMSCVDPMSVPNGGGCPLQGGAVGDGAVCQSGLCGVATLLDLIPIGVCGECLDDMDCMAPATCTPPVADMSGLMGATCN